MPDDLHDLDQDLTRPLAGAKEASVAEGGTSPAVGRDEWVARHGEHRAVRSGFLGKLEQRLRVVPWWAWLVLFLAVFALLPLGFESGYVRRVAFDTVLFMLLALGLNVVVGWGGLLDLGYVAFYGIGAYTYAFLASDKFDLHLPTIVVLPLVVVIGAVAGYLVGLPSRRLTGDYLAIVTLFFLLLFGTMTTNGNDAFGRDLTGGANGILNADPLSLFGRELVVTKDGIFNVAYLYVVLAAFAIVYVALRFLNDSRTGRAWRSLREDPLAAELMGMPVNSLKLLAFSCGAAVAALTGSFLAALSSSVFPQTFSFALLITIYTMVILGGAGSQAGAVLGAIVISVGLELLREPGNSRFLFYAAVILCVLSLYRASVELAVIVGGTLGFGFLVRELAGRIDDSWVGGVVNEGGRLGDGIADWVIVPVTLETWVGPVAYVSLIALLLALTLLDGWWRVALLIPTLYLGAFVWENVLLARPEVTRYILLGAMLVGLMIVRPNGLLGEKRVQVV